MDTATTVVLAATTGTALLKKRWGTTGVVLFTASALLPDLDQPFLGGALGYVQHHRGFTHSFVGVVAGALALAGIARLLRARQSFRALFAIALGGFLLAIATDLLTWWGTQVLWPFSRRRVGVGVIFIMDFWISGIVLAPWIVALTLKLFRRPVPALTFRIPVALVAAWLVLCLACRSTALGTLERLCREEGSEAVDVFPQPYSPFRWSMASDHGDRYRLRFVDLLEGREVLEARVFPKGEGGPADATDRTEAGRTMLWFHRLPVREVRALPDGRTEVVYRDLAYEMRTPRGRGSPFRYRFVLEGDRVVEQGMLKRR